MPNVHTADEVVWRTWNWCVDAYRRCGQTLKFPEATEPTKTYQWRYATRLARQLEEWEFDEQTSLVFIRYAVEYARKKGLLRKGLSAFFQSNILDICYDRIKSECNEVDRRLTLLRQSHSFLSARANGRPIVDVLLSRPAPNTYYNIVQWFERHRVSTIYLALSKSCTAALSKLAKLDSEQRSLLPGPADLFCLMGELTDNATFGRQAARILGDDWRTL